jgi:hypothetical protein
VREPVPLERLLRGVDQDVEVLANEGIGLGGAPPLQLGEGLLRGRRRALVEPWLQVQHLLVEPGHADLSRAFRREAGEHLQEDLGIFIALRDPRRASGGRRGGGGRTLRDREPAAARGAEGKNGQHHPHLSHFASQSWTSR